MGKLQGKTSWQHGLVIGGLMLLAWVSTTAHALPLFARQTGQNCLACHAGGQFPELTPYGRMFKLTGYTLGKRTEVPLAAMVAFSAASIANSADTTGNLSFEKNATPVLLGASLFGGGKVTDNVGLFAQVSYDRYGQTYSTANGTVFAGHSAADSIDLRYADRFVSPASDLIIGVSLNNKPSVSDVWNTAPEWIQYVPDSDTLGAHQFSDAHAPYPGYGLDAQGGGQAAGVNFYTYWNKLLYGEIGLYRTANQAFSVLSAGSTNDQTTQLKGFNNPYWRIAATGEWGAQNLMVGASGMTARIFDAASDIHDANNLGKIQSIGVDAQYQYLLDPHTVTAQWVYMRQRTQYSPNAAAALTDSNGNAPTDLGNASDHTQVERGKLSYTYQAKYGGSLSYFAQSGSNNWQLGDPGIRGMTYETFFLPIQYVRVGLQYTAYSRYNGGKSYTLTSADGTVSAQRSATDNNTLLLYLWAAY